MCIRAFAAPAVHVNRQVTRRMRRSTAWKDRSGLLRRGLSARLDAPALSQGCAATRDATRLSTIYSRSPVINILEGGTAQRKTRHRRTGRVQPLRIVETAVQQTQQDIVPEYTRYLNGPQGLEKVIRRAADRVPQRP